MTDEEILKAFECCCGDDVNGTHCKDCPAEKYNFDWCSDEVLRQMVDYIKRLKAENAALRERLSKAVELPCKVGDTVYEIIDGEIRETEVIQLKIDNMGLWITIRMGFGVSTVLFNKVARIYLTREAAEARLKELQGGEE